MFCSAEKWILLFFLLLTLPYLRRKNYVKYTFLKKCLLETIFLLSCSLHLKKKQADIFLGSLTISILKKSILRHSCWDFKLFFWSMFEVPLLAHSIRYFRSHESLDMLEVFPFKLHLKFLKKINLKIFLLVTLALRSVTVCDVTTHTPMS